MIVLSYAHITGGLSSHPSSGVRLGSHSHPDRTIITYPNLGHEFHPSSQWFTGHGPIPEYVLQDIFSWLSKPIRN